MDFLLECVVVQSGGNIQARQETTGQLLRSTALVCVLAVSVSFLGGIDHCSLMLRHEFHHHPSSSSTTTTILSQPRPSPNQRLKVRNFQAVRRATKAPWPPQESPHIEMACVSGRPTESTKARS